jgi:hypothetical protein
MNARVALPALALALACAHELRLDTAPDAPAAAAQPSVSAGRPLAIEWVRLSSNGRAAPVDPRLVAAPGALLRAAGAFSEVYDPAVAHRAPEGSLRLALDLAAEHDRRFPSIFATTPLSLITVGPFTLLLPFEYEEHVVSEARLHAPGGRRRTLRAEATGRVGLTLYADEGKAARRLARAVSEAAVGAIVNRILEAEALRPEAAALSSPPASSPRSPSGSR